jgi:hypothetical protein
VDARSSSALWRRVRFILGHHIWGLQSPSLCQENNAPRADDGSSVGAGSAGMILAMAARRALAGLSEIGRWPNERAGGGPCWVSLLIFEPEEIIVSVKLDSCYRSFSSFSAPGVQALKSRPEIASSTRNPANKPPAPGRSRAVALPQRRTQGKFSSLQSFEKSQNGEGISPEPREENNPHGTGSSKTRGSAEIISTAAARGHRRGISLS